MTRTGVAILAAVGLAVLVGTAGMITASGVLASESGAPSVLVDEPLAKASYDLLDVAIPDDLRKMDEEAERATGRGVIRTKKGGNQVTWTFELDDVDFVTVEAHVSAASETKSALDVNVQLEDSPLTDEGGLLPTDVVIIENALDAALTEHIAAKLEGRPVDRGLMDGIEARIELATLFQREAFEDRVEAALASVIKPRLEKYAEQARRLRRDRYDDYSGHYDDYQARRAQREASAPTSSAAPMTQLPSSRY